ncbi:MAG: nucleotide exchange factor GrpE [Clostridiales bacterium]|nr:nucleotide exchange factor GrpE [Clostridiales bacterium]
MTMSKKKEEEIKETVEETNANDDYQSVEEVKEEQPISKEEEYLALAQRIQADFDNYRKRNVTLRADALSDGKVEAVKAFLPVLDNLERALETERKNGTTGSLMEGLEIVLKQMLKSLSDLGVQEIEALNKPFDPTCHNAMMQIPAQEGQEKGVVATVFEKGYKMGDKIIRYSMVQVTKP